MATACSALLWHCAHTNEVANRPSDTARDAASPMLPAPAFGAGFDAVARGGDAAEGAAFAVGAPASVDAAAAGVEADARLLSFFCVHATVAAHHVANRAVLIGSCILHSSHGSTHTATPPSRGAVASEMLPSGLTRSGGQLLIERAIRPNAIIYNSRASYWELPLIATCGMVTLVMRCHWVVGESGGAYQTAHGSAIIIPMDGVIDDIVTAGAMLDAYVAGIGRHREP